MIKKIIILVILILLLGAGYFLIFGLEKELPQNTISQPHSTSSKSSNSKQETHTELTLIEYGKKNNYEKGYYYIAVNDENENIKYFDYSAQKEIYLCNKPNCPHTSKTCPSYLSLTAENQLFVYQEHLYLINSTFEETSSAQDTSNIGLTMASQSSPNIYRMNLDGTDKTKLFQIPSGMNLDLPYVLQDDFLYGCLYKVKSIEIGANTSQQIETERKLVRIHLDTGKYDELKDMNNKKIIGVFQNNILFEEILYKQDPKDFLKDDSGYINNLNQSKVRLSLLNIESMKEEVLLEDSYPSLEEKEVGAKKVFFIGKGSRKLEYVDMQTKERGTLLELSKQGADIIGIYDNKLQYAYYSKTTNSTEIESAYYIDLSSNENKAFTLLNDSKQIVEILSQNQDYYFVTTGYKLSKPYKTWAGTTQSNVEEIYYGLISKQDYWNSTPNYIRMKNTD